MGKLACLSVFGRKIKLTKLKLSAHPLDQAKQGMGEDDTQHDLTVKVKLFEGELTKELAKTPQLVNDYLDSCSNCSETVGTYTSKDAGSEQINESAEKLQLVKKLPAESLSSGEDTLMVQKYTQGDEPENVVVLIPEGDGPENVVVLIPEAREHFDMSTWSPTSHENSTIKAVVSANDLASGSGSESIGLPLKDGEMLGIDSQVDCAYESEDGFEASDSESYRRSCEDLTGPLSGETAPDAHTAQYFQRSDPLAFHSGHFFEDGAESPIGEMAAQYGDDAETGGAGFLDSPDIGVFQSNKSDRIISDDEIMTGHISDPGVYHREDLQSTYESPVLHSSCSIVPSSEIRDFMYLQNPGADQEGVRCEFDMLKSATSGDAGENVSVMDYSGQVGNHGSPPSESTFGSADKVMLKPDSSSKVLSLSKRKSWWKIFMVNHRNIHRETRYQSSEAAPLGEAMDGRLANPMTGYTSDMCDGGRTAECTGSVMDDQTGKDKAHAKTVSSGQGYDFVEDEGASNLVFQSGLETSLQASTSGMAFWPSKEWIAFPSEASNRSRVEEWVSNIHHLDLPPDGDIISQEINAFASEKKELCIENQREEVGETSSAIPQEAGALTIDAELANAAVRSLNAFSTVAHISGIGLKEVPCLGMFNSLKTLNLSANCIVRVPPGCLPRSLHSLDLSRNRIALIEGFRELTRLRVLNLSYNRISRIGHGLANCTLIKELYLAGNKIAEVEGLHRLLKLSVLDLSFNKLTTSKALGQLAANYSSLLALNLLGNPVHLNVGEEQLRKLVSSITPHVTYLNKQPIKAVPAREAVVDSVARAALGTSQRNRGTRRGAGTQSAALQKSKLPSHRSKEVDTRCGPSSTGSELSRSARAPKHHHHRSDNQHLEKGVKEHKHSSRTAPLSVHEHLLRRLAIDTGSQGMMPRSRSDGALQDQHQ